MHGTCGGGPCRFAGDEAAAAGGDAAPVQFLADAMLGRLAKWLRVLGVDTAVCAEGERDPGGSLRGAASSGRVLLTRDRRFARRARAAGVRHLHVQSNDTEVQLQEVTSAFALVYESGDFMSRCSACNGLGFDLITPEEARARGVKERVFEVVSVFYACRACRKVFWSGPKSETAESMFRRFTNGVVRAATTDAGEPLEASAAARGAAGTAGSPRGAFARSKYVTPS